jgi:hypothetical protein
VVEVPILFQDRAVGESKMSLRQQWLYVRHLGRLYAARFWTRRGETRESEWEGGGRRRAA